MIDGLYSALESYQGQQEQNNTQPRKVLRMIKNERMGGSVPMWETIKEPDTSFEKNLATAVSSQSAATPETALAYNATSPTPAQHTDEFGFGDLIDMVNPLHHVPVVGHVYRELTGDEIKPIGQIIGGAIFGGPMGAASGLINTVIEQETGKDMAGNAMALVFNTKDPATSNPINLPDNPETRLAAITDNSASDIQDLPGNLLAFADLKPKIVIERITAAQGRTAGSISKTSYPALSHELPMREPITQIRLGTYKTNEYSDLRL